MRYLTHDKKFQAKIYGKMSGKFGMNCKNKFRAQNNVAEIYANNFRNIGRLLAVIIYEMLVVKFGPKNVCIIISLIHLGSGWTIKHSDIRVLKFVYPL